MSRYIHQGWWFDGNGKVVKSGTVTVYLNGSSTLASVYTASTGGTAVNSVTASTTDGSWSFYVDTDDYSRTQKFKIVFSKSGFTSKTVDDVVIFPLTNLAWTNVVDHGATGDGVTDDAAAIQEAIDSVTAYGRVYVPAGTYLIGSQLTIADEDKIVLYGDGYGSIIKKGFNGAMLSLGLDSEVYNLHFDGEGGTYTGRGIIIEAGTLGTGRQKIRDCRIWDTASYCIEFTAAVYGWLATVSGCELRVTSDDVHAIKLPATEANGNRTIINCNAGHGPLIHMGGSRANLVVGCTGGTYSAAVNTLSFDNDNTAYANTFIGNRFATGGYTQTIYGEDQSFVGNQWAGNITFASGSTNNTFKDDITAFTLTDSGTGNQAFTRTTTYTCNVTATTTSPTLDATTVNASYVRNGHVVTVSIEMTIDSSGSWDPGTGTWIFSLPFSGIASRTQMGTAWMYDSDTGTTTLGAANNLNEAAGLRIYYSTTAAGATAPYTWATGDTITITFTYIATEA